MRGRDRGSMTVLVMLVAVSMTAAVTLAVVPVLGELQARQRARSAADAAALAGVNGGVAASAALADANGAALVAWRRDGGEVVVTVAVDGRRAQARATDRP